MGDENGNFLAVGAELTEDCPTRCGCGRPTHWLAKFPGDRCLACWRVLMEGAPLPSAAEVVAAWRG